MFGQVETVYIIRFAGAFGNVVLEQRCGALSEVGGAALWAIEAPARGIAMAVCRAVVCYYLSGWAWPWQRRLMGSRWPLWAALPHLAQLNIRRDRCPLATL
jgi:hypothetical protein